MNKKSIYGVIMACFAAASIAGATEAKQDRSDRSTPYSVVTYPGSIDTECRDGIAKVYDECSDQGAILSAAQKRANESGKSVLLVYGAEWCIWCHVFDKYINGQHRRFNYQWEYEGELAEWEMHEKDNPNAGQEARGLNRYVAENFVVAHIEGHYSPNGLDVIEGIGFDSSKVTFLPFIFVLDRDGMYAGHMLAYDAIPGMEIREDSGEEYRGFDRKILLRELKKLRELSLASAASR